MSTKIRIKHSATANDTPTAAQIPDAGELAINTNAASLRLFARDSAGAVRVIGGSGSGITGPFGYWNRTGTVLNPVNAGDDVFTAGDIRVGNTNAAANIKLNAAGTGEFKYTAAFEAGAIFMNKDATGNIGGKAGGVALGAIFDAGTGVTTSYTQLLGYKDNNTNSDVDGGFILKVRRKNDGAPGDFSEALRVTKDRELEMGGAPGISPNISLNPDGSAQFERVINAGNNSNVSPLSVRHAVFGQTNRTGDNGAAVFFAKNSAAFADTSYCFIARGNSDDNQITLSNNGAARFAGDVTIGGTAASPNIELDEDGSGRMTDLACGPAGSSVNQLNLRKEGVFGRSVGVPADGAWHDVWPSQTLSGAWFVSASVAATGIRSILTCIVSNCLGNGTISSLNDCQFCDSLGNPIAGQKIEIKWDGPQGRNVPQALQVRTATNLGVPALQVTVSFIQINQVTSSENPVYP